MKNDFYCHAKKARMVLLAVISLVFAALGIFITAVPFNEPLLPMILGIVVGIVFGLCFLYYICVLIKRKPAVVVTQEGIMDHSSFIGAGLVRWEEIEAIEFLSFPGQVYLGIFTLDRKLIIDRSNGMKKLFTRLNQGLLPSQVNIPLYNLACSAEELVQAIEERRERAMKKKS
ncbi:STM3941 family protein [Siminovitchia sediminis]|uniref:STM3941 family protein n=1 Tax=Siminovitchia sediminis TaxID=1274353 RepID=A0ABW4KF82_9BACI